MHIVRKIILKEIEKVYGNAQSMVLLVLYCSGLWVLGSIYNLEQIFMFCFVMGGLGVGLGVKEKRRRGVFRFIRLIIRMMYANRRLSILVRKVEVFYFFLQRVSFVSHVSAKLDSMLRRIKKVNVSRVLVKSCLRRSRISVGLANFLELS